MRQQRGNTSALEDDTKFSSNEIQNEASLLPNKCAAIIIAVATATLLAVLLGFVGYNNYQLVKVRQNLLEETEVRDHMIMKLHQQIANLTEYYVQQMQATRRVKIQEQSKHTKLNVAHNKPEKLD